MIIKKDFEEFQELMSKTNEPIDKVIEWMIKHKEDDYFKTEDGKIMNDHICEMARNHAWIYSDMANICIQMFNEEVQKHKNGGRS